MFTFVPRALMRFSNNDKETICNHRNLAICSIMHFRALGMKVYIYLIIHKHGLVKINLNKQIHYIFFFFC